MSYRFITLVFIVFSNSMLLPSFAQQGTQQSPFGEGDPFSDGIKADDGKSVVRADKPPLVKETESQRLRTEINKLKRVQVQLHSLIDRAVKQTQQTAKGLEGTAKPQREAKLLVLAEKLFVVEQAVTDAEIRLKRQGLAIQVAEAKKRALEKKTITNQRVKKWLESRVNEVKDQPTAPDDQPFGDGDDPFSASSF